ncbi:hypothetical protein [Nocardia flavorosea]|uniref:Uncharacterized protein n=1 Tax=Nocardia flavorosea TaxID=53429 RepID=A0A846Y7M3_9NOCA|nr:hypothetical protein [Nocardia flavorosea]NKY55183.1 hypothetical protein [Nocardia flavorosea]
MGGGSDWTATGFDISPERARAPHTRLHGFEVVGFDFVERDEASVTGQWFQSASRDYPVDLEHFADMGSGVPAVVFVELFR